MHILNDILNDFCVMLNVLVINDIIIIMSQSMYLVYQVVEIWSAGLMTNLMTKYEKFSDKISHHVYDN